MGSSLQSIAQFLEAAEDLFASLGGRPAAAAAEPWGEPVLLAVLDGDGTLISAREFEGRMGVEEIRALAGEVAGKVQRNPACAEGMRGEGGRCVFAIRLPECCHGKILFCVLRQESPAAMPRGASEITGIVADSFAWALVQLQENEDKARTRITHLQAEQETLRASHAEAIAAAIEEREERLREQQEHVAQLQAVMMMAADGIVTIDELGTIESFNEAAAWIFGYTAEEVIGENIAMLVPVPHRQRHEACLWKYMSQGGRGRAGFGREVTGQRKDGTIFPLDLAVSEVCLGSRRIFTGIFRDITERKRAEEELRRLHLQNEMILNSAGEGICGLDSSGRTIFANPAAEKMLGWTASELIGQPLHERIHHPKANSQPYPRSECRLCNIAIGTGAASRNGEVFWRKDGSSFPVEYTGTPIREGEKIIGAVLTFRDTTERRMLEAQLRQAQKLESIGQLAAGIAHEINTPTQYIGDNTRFLQDGFNGLSTLLVRCLGLRDLSRDRLSTEEMLRGVLAGVEQSDVEYYLDEIPKAIAQTLEGVDRVAKIVRSMKEFSHPGGEEMQGVDLNLALESTLTVSRNEWKYVADVVTEFDEHLPLVTCMPADCNQVFLNLIVNAAHAIADKVGKAGTGKGTITVRTRRQGEAVEVQIADTGTGIPEEIRSRVYDPFFTTKEVGRGTGQGLAIAHTIVVEKHGGSITFESQVGLGTTFFVRIPIGLGPSQTGGLTHETSDPVR